MDRDALRPEHFAGWTAWAKEKGHGLDFNPTLFSHPKADSGLTLASYDAGIRSFWIDHCIACRVIGESFGRELGTPCVTNIWIADGMKDTPADRKTPRLHLKDALDKILAYPVDRSCNLDAIEGKLFGLGAESYTVGSHEFYLGYAVANRTLVALDSGHYHPTETIADKLSAVLTFVDEVLLHVSRGVRWDSDHVVTLTDDLQAIAQELVRGDYLGRTHIGLDYFDASINRIAAWVIGTRNMQRALLMALLEPSAHLAELERAGDYTSRLALQEAIKTPARRRGLGHLLPAARSAGGHAFHGGDQGVRGSGAGETIVSLASSRLRRERVYGSKCVAAILVRVGVDVTGVGSNDFSRHRRWGTTEVVTTNLFSATPS